MFQKKYCDGNQTFVLPQDFKKMIVSNGRITIDGDLFYQPMYPRDKNENAIYDHGQGHEIELPQHYNQLIVEENTILIDGKVYCKIIPWFRYTMLFINALLFFSVITFFAEFDLTLEDIRHRHLMKTYYLGLLLCVVNSFLLSILLLFSFGPLLYLPIFLLPTYLRPIFSWKGPYAFLLEKFQ